MNYLNVDIEDIVDELTNEKFTTFCGIDGCNEAILDAVRERVKVEVERLVYKNKKNRVEVILSEAPKLTAIFYSEKSLYEMKTNEEDQKEKKTVRITLTTQTPVPVAITSPVSTLTATSFLKSSERTTAAPLNQAETKHDFVQNVKNSIQLNLYKQDVDNWSRIKGLEIRGKNYKNSNDGACPRCGHNSNVFVILDFLFPSGDMPDILFKLLGEGKAVLWSKKQNMNCKDPPTFLCSGKCPFNDIKKCGFNINWKQTDLEKIFFDKKTTATAPVNTKSIILKKVCATEGDATEKEGTASTTVSKNSKVKTVSAGPDKSNSGSGSPYSDYNPSDGEEVAEEYDEGDVDIVHYRKSVSWFVLDEYTREDIVEEENNIALSDEDSKAMIRTMLALEQARLDFVEGKMKTLQQHHDGEPCEETLQGGDRGVNEISSSPERDSPQNSSELTTTTRIVADIESLAPPLEQQHQQQVISPSTTGVVSTAVTTTSPPSSWENQLQHHKHSQDEVQEVPMDIDIYDLDEEGKVLPDDRPSPAFISTTNDSAGKKAGKKGDEFPVSLDGSCPYCKSTTVVYIVLKEKADDKKLPDLLARLNADGYAEVHYKGEHEWPSFQCRSCQYGFNLDWNKTNLQKIFYPTSYSNYNNFYQRYNTNSNINYNTNNFGSMAVKAAVKAADAFIAAQRATLPYIVTAPPMWGGMIPAPMPMPISMPGMVPMFPFPGMIPPPPPAVATTNVLPLVTTRLDPTAAPAPGSTIVTSVTTSNIRPIANRSLQRVVLHGSPIVETPLSSTQGTPSVVDLAMSTTKKEDASNNAADMETVEKENVIVIEDDVEADGKMSLQTSLTTPTQQSPTQPPVSVETEQPNDSVATTSLQPQSQTTTAQQPKRDCITDLRPLQTSTVLSEQPNVKRDTILLEPTAEQLNTNTKKRFLTESLEDQPEPKKPLLAVTDELVANKRPNTRNQRSANEEIVKKRPNSRRSAGAVSGQMVDSPTGNDSSVDSVPEEKVESTFIAANSSQPILHGKVTEFNEMTFNDGAPATNQQTNTANIAFEEKSATTAVAEDNNTTNEEVGVVVGDGASASLSNLEVMLDDPSTVDDVALSLASATTSNISSDGIGGVTGRNTVLRSEEPASGASSPFTDSLFNIVADNVLGDTDHVLNSHITYNTKDVNNSNFLSVEDKANTQEKIDASLLQKTQTSPSLASLSKQEKIPLNEQGETPSHSTKEKTVYVPMIDEDSMSDTKVATTLETGVETTSDIDSDSKTLESSGESTTRPKRINISNFF